MRYIIALILSFTLSAISHAQEVLNLTDIPLNTPEDYRKAEDSIIKCAELLFAMPMDAPEGERVLATRFIYKWLEGTPHYHFLIEEWITEINNKEPHLLGLYLSAMASYSIKYPHHTDDYNLIQLDAANRIIEYIQNEENKVKQTPRIRKMIKAMNEGTLLKFLNLNN